MADEMYFKMEQEDWQQETNDPCTDPLDTGTDWLKEDVKSEQESSYKTVDDFQFAFKTEDDGQSETYILKEEIKSDQESPNETVQDIQFATAGLKDDFKMEQEDWQQETNDPCTDPLDTGSSQRLARKNHEYQRSRRTSPLSLAKKNPAALELSAKLNEPGNESRKLFKRSDCKYSTDYLEHFNKHLTTHTGERRYPCAMCEYKATQKCNLKTHILKHSDVKPFACAVCNYRSVQKSDLTKHMRLHTGEKPFKCTQCDFACNQLGTLVSHVRARHSKERPFACTQCEYTCVTSSNLASHMLKHRADKKFSCSHCEFKSNFARNVKRHVAAKHNG